ncbi:MAG: hypothetical protein ACREUM_00910, partial [Nitrosospira sp.]
MLQNTRLNAIVKPEAFRLIGGKDDGLPVRPSYHTPSILSALWRPSVRTGHLEDTGADFYSTSLGCLDDENLRETDTL